MSNKTLNDRPEKTASARKTPLPTVLAVFIVVLILGLLGIIGKAVRAPECNEGVTLPVTTLRAGGVEFQAEVAKDGETQARGLSGRSCLAHNRAMLFVYHVSGDYCYWMKDMRFAIDMIWLDDEKRVVTIKDRVVPDTYPQSFCPERPAQYVVEVPAGTAKKLDFKSGTQFEFSL